MTTILACLLAAIFGFLGGVHVYWGFGGRWAAASAVPSRADGKPIFSPGLRTCLIVAAGLFAFGYVCLLHAAFPADLPLSGRLPTRWILRGMAGIFALRTLGDFRYFGIFRRNTTTEFARRDRASYTPFCAALAGALLWLAGSR